jgi:hypothetical protein
MDQNLCSSYWNFDRRLGDVDARLNGICAPLGSANALPRQLATLYPNTTGFTTDVTKPFRTPMTVLFDHPGNAKDH